MQHESSLDRLLECRRWALSVASGLVGDPHRAEDLLHDVYLRAVEYPPSAAHNPCGWLMQSLRNRSIDVMRSENASSRREFERAYVRDEGAEQEDALELEERREAIRVTIEGMPAPLREIIELRYFHGLQPAELAKELNINASTARSRLKKARDELRDRLERRHLGLG